MSNSQQLKSEYIREARLYLLDTRIENRIMNGWLAFGQTKGLGRARIEIAKDLEEAARFRMKADRLNQRSTAGVIRKTKMDRGAVRGVVRGLGPKS
jgi:hypothetical protein